MTTPGLAAGTASAHDLATWLTVAPIVLLLAVSAFLSGSEAALIASSRARLRNRAERGDDSAAVALELTEDSERLIGALHVGRIIANVLTASLATGLFLHLYGLGGEAVAVLITVILVLVLAEILPRALAARDPEETACRVARAVRAFTTPLAPVVAIARLAVGGFLALFRHAPDPEARLFSVQREIVDALDLGHSSGTVLKEERDLLRGALDLGDRAVEEIMLHRSRIEMIDADLPTQAVLDRVLKSPHTRLPIFRGERENVIAVIHAKDLLRGVSRAVGEGGSDALEGFDILSVAMPPYFVPDTTPLDEQMREFLARRTHFALVVDEYGDLRGLITLEDILEEIVGEITDEHDTDIAQSLTPNDAGDYSVDGATTIRDLNRALDWSLPDEEANTVAGLVIHAAQSIPTPGQVFSFHGYRFEVVARRENRITRLRIRPLVAPPPSGDEGRGGQ
ncbi:HlyC/CorC family transporter [Paracoccus sp. KR1-242]|uniref:HlyC/CorC family transporter n=1 Tax=Paracoccus sp. KR1-242 TaxID=3410028 RepID=UPI003BFE7B97